MGIREAIKKNKKLKDVLHAMVFSSRGACPRWWVRIIVNPVYFMREKSFSSRIRRYVRMHISPLHRFALGRYSVIEYFSVVDNGVGDVLIGDNVRVGLRNTIIGPAMIGNNVILAQNVVLSGMNHNYENPEIAVKDQAETRLPIFIGEASWIGANVTVTAGVRIGAHSVVGAGSVVTKDVPDYAVAVGNPARVIKIYNRVTRQWERVDNAASQKIEKE